MPSARMRGEENILLLASSLRFTCKPPVKQTDRINWNIATEIANSITTLKANIEKTMWNAHFSGTWPEIPGGEPIFVGRNLSSNRGGNFGEWLALSRL